MTRAVRVVVTPDLDGERADLIVARLTGASRAVAKELCEKGEVRMGGRHLAPTERPEAGSQLDVLLPDPEVIEPRLIQFDVLYEDDEVLVVDKPAGLVVHPGAGHRDDTLVSGLLHRFPELTNLAGEHRWGLVHRLDRGTSGALLVARTATAHELLQSEMRKRNIDRHYVALVIGRVEAATGTIDAPLDRDPRRPTRRAVVRGGRRAQTHYRRRAVWPDLTLLDLTLGTGRTHQIRVHCAWIGHPVVGDRTYGRASNHPAEPGRVWLHAAKLRFRHPTGATISIESPLPLELCESLDRLVDPTAGSIDDLIGQCAEKAQPGSV